MAKKKPVTYLEAAETWPTLTPAKRALLLKQLPPDVSTEFFLDLAAADQLEFLLALPPGERRSWIRMLAPDDLADVIQAAPLAEHGALLAQLDESTRASVTALMAYAEDEAGGLMNPKYIRLRPDMTAGQALGYFRRQAQDRTGQETPAFAYVLAADERLLGEVALTDLIAAEPETSVTELMRSPAATISEEADQEHVAHLFAEHGLVAAPVVDSEGRMKGVVTADDVVVVVEEEATEDIQKLGGSEALDAPYLKTSLIGMIQKRAGWLGLLFVGEMLTATAMAKYETEIARAVVLALFVPLMISSGGNSGSQASTLVIRAMALGEVRLGQWWRVLRREAAAGLALGCVLALIGLLRILVWQYASGIYGPHYVAIAATVSLSLIGIVMWGTISGSMLPFVLQRFGLDPASASAPFVATLVDVSGIVIYFTVASYLLAGKLL